MVSNLCGLRWVKNSFKNPNATECAEGELEKIGHSGQQPTQNTQCNSYATIGGVSIEMVRIPTSSRFPKNKKMVDSLDQKEVREHTNT